VVVTQAQGEEPPEFLALFPRYRITAAAEALPAGLAPVEFALHPTRLFVLVFAGTRATLDLVRPVKVCVCE
jgi:hypothetical protein